MQYIAIYYKSFHHSRHIIIIGNISLGCASTGLATTVYDDDFFTAHALFGLPVIEGNDRDEADQKMECELDSKPQRRALVLAARLILWDEFPSNHRECMEAVHRFILRCGDECTPKIFVCLGDFRQIAPVVEGGDSGDIINACIQTSALWESFEVFVLKRNMRLEAYKESLRVQLLDPNLSVGEKQDIQMHFDNQIRFGELILNIGEGKQDRDYEVLSYDRMTHCQKIQIKSIETFYESVDEKKKILMRSRAL